MKSPVAVFSVVAALTQAVSGPSHAAIAFSALVDERWVVYVQLESGSAPVRVDPAHGGDASAPTLAPGKVRIAYEVPGQGIRVCSVESVEGLCRTILGGGGTDVRPVWDPAGESLAFSRFRINSEGEDSQIFRAATELERGEPVFEQTGIQDHPDFSPDGETLVYTSAQSILVHRGGMQVAQHLWLLSLTTGAARPLVPSSHQDTHPDWSPAGDRIAFASNRSGRFEIWTVSSDGGDLRQLTSGAGTKMWPAWSPDGKRLLYTKIEEGRYSLWSVTADGLQSSRFDPFRNGAETQLRDADWR